MAFPLDPVPSSANPVARPVSSASPGPFLFEVFAARAPQEGESDPEADANPPIPRGYFRVYREDTPMIEVWIMIINIVMCLDNYD